MKGKLIEDLQRIVSSLKVSDAGISLIDNDPIELLSDYELQLVSGGSRNNSCTNSGTCGNQSKNFDCTNSGNCDGSVNASCGTGVVSKG